MAQDWYNTAPRRLCARALHGVLKEPEGEVVVLSQVLAQLEAFTRKS